MQELIDALEIDEEWLNRVSSRDAATVPALSLELDDSQVLNELKLKRRFSVDSGGFARFLSSLGWSGLTQLAKFRNAEPL
jgi:hypothetical protein